MKKLNPEQSAAVLSKNPLILAIAGAGSGKTTVLVDRIARLIADGADPRGFVVITFTNAAAAEIEKRIYDDGSGDKVQAFQKLGFIGTLHGFLLRLLTKHHALVGLPSSLSVFDDDQRTGLVEQVMAEMRVKEPKKNVMPLLKRPDLVDGARGMRTKAELVSMEYNARLRRAGLLDFDGILHYGEKLVLRFADDMRSEWPYTHLFVDEFQDSADADARIYRAMPCAYKFMVGDPDQAIYSFRGGNVRNILDLAEGHNGLLIPNAWQVLKLETNYRCGSAICEVAQRLIERNTDRYPKRTVAAFVGGAVVAQSFPTPASELAYVTHELTRNNTGSGGRMVSAPIDELRECAVLARTNKIASAFADHLRGLGVPVAERKLAEVPGDWRLAKLALTVLANPWCDMAVHRLLSETRGPEHADMLAMASAKSMRPLFDAGFGADVPTVDDFLSTIALSPESRARIREASAMLASRGEWSLNDLVAALAAGEERAAVDGDGVTVTTFHSAKGREWGTVFMVGCEEGVCPSGRKGSDIEEERRLFYVAMTRAKRRLLISWCDARPQNRGPNMPPGPPQPCEPSRFVAEAANNHPTTC